MNMISRPFACSCSVDFVLCVVLVVVLVLFSCAFVALGPSSPVLRSSLGCAGRACRASVPVSVWAPVPLPACTRSSLCGPTRGSPPAAAADVEATPGAEAAGRSPIPAETWPVRRSSLLRQVRIAAMVAPPTAETP